MYSSLLSLAFVLPLLAQAVDFNFTTFSDRGCNTVQNFTEGFPPGNPGYCTKFPAGVQSVIADMRGVTFAIAETRFFATDDCTGFSIGQAQYDAKQELTGDFPVPAGQCIDSQPVNSTFGSYLFGTYR